jgi:serine/threonine protein kinase
MQDDHVPAGEPNGHFARQLGKHSVHVHSYRGHQTREPIRNEIARDPRALARFRREIQLAHKVTHVNVCRIYDLMFEDLPGGKVPFLTMELLSGPTLAERLEAGRPSVEEALSIAAQLCAGLQAAHDAGILHRDLKSSNVVLVPEAQGLRVVLTDFGLARTRSDNEAPADTQVTRAGVVLGTPAYMAPEVLGGAASTVASDIYALGAVLLELTTGRRSSDDARGELGAAPGRWGSAIRRCMAVDPRHRFASARDVLAALRSRTPRRAATAVTLVVLAAAIEPLLPDA